MRVHIQTWIYAGIYRIAAGFSQVIYRPLIIVSLGGPFDRLRACLAVQEEQG